MKKFKLTENTKQICLTTIYQIEALKDFSDVKKGDVGGWVEKESNLSQEGDCWIYNDSVVINNACVCNNARVINNAFASGNASIINDVIVSENSRICNNAIICGNSKVYGNGFVYCNAIICDDVIVDENASVGENVCAYNKSRIYGNALVNGDINIFGLSQIHGRSLITNKCNINKSPLQIQGSRHFLNINGNELQIGCQCHTIRSWLTHFEKIGKIENYTKEEIDEYKKYIDLANNFINN